MISDIASWPQELADALHNVLCRRLPPDHNTEQELKPIIGRLIEATSAGWLSITIDSVDVEQTICDSGWLDPLVGPLVLSDGQLFWKRWHDELKMVSDNLLQRAANPPSLNESGLAVQSQNLNWEQRMAINAIGRERVILLSGSPGTGKTSTIQGMLQRARALNPELRIGLAAPTGKAARRLLQIIGDIPGAISCGTLHHWLEARREKFGRNARHPLNLDLLIVDEMSMVDLRLMQALLNALPSQTCLVLVGDPDQLNPIGLGPVWRYLQQPKVKQQFGKTSFHLHHVYRSRGDLARLGVVLRNRGEKAFWNNLEVVARQKSGKTIISWQQEEITVVPELLQNRLRLHRDALETAARNLDLDKIQSMPSLVQDLFRQLESLMVLCPRRHGYWSVEAIHSNLLPFLPSELAQPLTWPVGTPVMCMENQPDLNLANGDLGVVIGDRERQRLLFGDAGTTNNPCIRVVYPARLRNVEPAYAMTVHKAQGSEADDVILLWPEVVANDRGLARRQLLYTAITRAKYQLWIITPLQRRSCTASTPTAE